MAPPAGERPRVPQEPTAPKPIEQTVGGLPPTMAA